MGLLDQRSELGLDFGVERRTTAESLFSRVFTVKPEVDDAGDVLVHGCCREGRHRAEEGDIRAERALEAKNLGSVSVNS